MASPLSRSSVDSRSAAFSQKAASSSSMGAPSTTAGPAAGVPKLQCAIAQETMTWMEDGVSEDFLRHYCETDDLIAVNRLDIQVDSAVQSVESLGDHLPNLRHLRLMNSSVLCVRDIGTTLLNLEVLWMSRCGLQDLNGVGALPALREFYLPFNDVGDLTPLSSHDNIEVLDIEGNAVESLEEVAALGICSELRELTLTGNPLCRSPGYSRQAVLELLPQLSVLDDLDRDAAAPVGGDCAEPSDLDSYIASFGTAIKGTTGVNAFAHEANVHDVEGNSSEEEHGHGDACHGSTPIASGMPLVVPLESSHPLLKEGLEALSSARSSRPNRHPGEPDEQELIVELVKRSRPKPQAHAFTARATVGATWGFQTQMPERRQVRTAEADPNMQFRPATTANSGFQFDDIRGSQETASDLTCGGSLAGNPLLAARHRRTQNAQNDASLPRESDMDIRELLRRYQTYTQPSCIPPEELQNRRRASEKGRPRTPDVRIHTAVNLQDVGRPGSSARRRGSRRASGSNNATQVWHDSSEEAASIIPTRTSSTGEVLVLEEEPMELS